MANQNFEEMGFDKSAIYENLDKLSECNYEGLVVIKSTVEPGFVSNLNKKYDFVLYRL